MGQNARADSVVNVVIDVGDAVGELDELALGGGGHRVSRMVDDGIPHLPAEVEAAAVLFQLLHHPQALAVVGEALIVTAGQRVLSCVAEGGVAEIVSQGGGLGEVFVQPKGAGHGAGDLGDLQGMGQAGAVVIPRGGEEHLGLVHEAAEGLAMDDAVAVALELAPQGARLHGALPSAGGGGSGSHGGQKQGLPLVHPLVEVHIHVFLPFCRPVGVAFFFPSIIYANVLRFTFIFCGNLRFLWEIFLFWAGSRGFLPFKRPQTRNSRSARHISRIGGL